MRYALVGNPNSGKTTLFNSITGASARVGNWPGVTVDIKEGTYRLDDSVKIIDMPGIYSTSPYSPEELVTRDYILNQNPDLIIDVVDVTNLERNLYLTTELLETDVPLIIALNFMDEAHKRRYRVDTDRLERALGVPIIPLSASKGEGVAQLMQVAKQTALLGRKATTVLKGSAFYEAVEPVVRLIESNPFGNCIYAAIKYLEGDEVIKEYFVNINETAKSRLDGLKQLARQASRNADSEAEIADLRYKFIERECSPCVIRPDDKDEITLSDKIDQVVLNRFVAIPVFLSVIAIIFWLTFGPFGTTLSTLTANGFTLCKSGLASAVTSLGGKEDGIAYGVVVEGVLEGVSAVLAVLPQILILFSCISLLEGSGYMARAAFIMDRLFRRFGMSGKSFVPLIMGFGCTLPAVMATRTIENDKARRLTIILTPFMSCGAKIPVYVLLTDIVFKQNPNLKIFGIAGVYLLGIVMTVLSGGLLKNTLLKGAPAPFLLELPEYRLPTTRNLLLTLWEKLKDFLTRAGTTITAASIIIWFLNNFSFAFKMVENTNHSILVTLSGGLKYLLLPIGLGTWQLVVTVVSGFAGKEMMCAAISALGGAAAVGLTSPAAALSLMTFTLLLPPCAGAAAAISHEMKSLKWSAFAFLFQTALAWATSFAIYNTALLFIP